MIFNGILIKMSRLKGSPPYVCVFDPTKNNIFSRHRENKFFGICTAAGGIQNETTLQNYYYICKMIKILIQIVEKGKYYNNIISIMCTYKKPLGIILVGI